MQVEILVLGQRCQQRREKLGDVADNLGKVRLAGFQATARQEGLPQRLFFPILPKSGRQRHRSGELSPELARSRSRVGQ